MIDNLIVKPSQNMQLLLGPSKIVAYLWLGKYTAVTIKSKLVKMIVELSR